MHLPPGYSTRLQAPTTPKVWLLTLSPDGLDPTDPYNHLATQPGVVRVATATCAVRETLTGIDWPFPGYLTDWPNVTYSLAIEQRRAEIPQVTVRVLASAGLAQLIEDRGGGLQMTYRLDLWIPGIALEHLMNWMAGYVSTPTYDSVTGGVSLTLTDGDPRRSVTWPQPFTHDEFLDAPQDTLDGPAMQAIIGAYPDAVDCPPIDLDRDGNSRRFFVSVGQQGAGPSEIQKAGVPFTAARVETAVSDGEQAIPYLQIVTDDPVAPTEAITCSGGVGITDADPLRILADIGGYQWTAEALALLSALDPLAYSYLANVSGPILDAIRGLVPETPFAFTSRHGKLHLIPLLAEAPQVILGLGTGLLFPLAQQPDRTDERYLWNRFKLNCGRNETTGTPLYTVYRDWQHCRSAAMSRWLYESERLYGPRTMPNDASGYLDLAVQMDAQANPIGCAAGEDLADLLALVHAFQCRQRAYQANWYDGLTADLGWLVELTESAQGILAQRARVAMQTIAATGPLLTLHVERTL